MTLKQAGLAIPVLLVLLILSVTIVSNTPLSIRVLAAQEAAQGPQGTGIIDIFQCTTAPSQSEPPPIPP